MSYRMPGEFEPHRGTIMIWPVRPGSWGVDPRPAQEAFCEVMARILESEELILLVDSAHREEAEALAPVGVHILEIESDDAWARDTGPTFLVRGEKGAAEAGIAQGEAEGAPVLGVDWCFNAWGGDVDGLYRHYERDDRLAGRVCNALGYPIRDAHPFILEGGSIHSDGEGTLMTTESCLLSAGRNRNLTKAEIEKTLCETLGAEKVLWLPRGIFNDETNEHVDNVCAFVRPGEVVLAWTEDREDPQYALSEACFRYLSEVRDARGRALKIHKLPIPRTTIRITEQDLSGYAFEEGEDQREVGERLAASYVNFYITNGAVLVPAFSDPRDAEAVRILQACFPERQVYSIPAREILLGGGNIHCITQQIPAGR